MTLPYPECIRPQVIAAMRDGWGPDDGGRPGLPKSRFIASWLRSSPSFRAEVASIAPAWLREGAPTIADVTPTLPAMDSLPPAKRKRNTPPRFKRTPEVRAATLEALRGGAKLGSLGPGLPTITILRKWRQDDPVFDAEVDAINRAHRRKGAYTYGPADKVAVLDALRSGGDMQNLGEGLPRVGLILRWRRQDPAFEADVMAIFNDRYGAVAANPRRAHMKQRTPELMRAIVAAYKAGNTLRALGDDLPSGKFIYDWRNEDAAFDAAVLAARPAFEAARQVREDALSRRQAAAATTRRRLLESEVYAAADKAVGRGYPPDVREDLVSEIMLAILDGSVALGDVKSAAPRIISAYWRGRDTYRCESMDAFVFDGRKGTLHELIGF